MGLTAHVSGSWKDVLEEIAKTAVPLGVHTGVARAKASTAQRGLQRAGLLQHRLGLWQAAAASAQAAEGSHPRSAAACRHVEMRPTTGPRPLVSSFSAQQLSLLAWSLARLGAAAAELLPLASAVQGRLGELSPRDVTDVVWALGHVGAKHPEFVAAAEQFAKARQQDFGTQEMRLEPNGSLIWR